MAILDTLRGRKSSADLAAALPDIAQALAGTRAEIEVLRTKLRSAPFELDPSSIKSLRADLREAEDELEMLIAADGETKTRLEAAQRSESEEKIRKLMNSVRKRQAAARTSNIEFNKLLDQLVQLGECITQDVIAVQEANAIAAAAGFEHLRLRIPHYSHGFKDMAAVTQLRDAAYTKFFEGLEAEGRL